MAKTPHAGKKGLIMTKDEGNREEDDSTATRFTYLLIGGGIGAIIALLFAPKSGQELRSGLADAARRGLDKSRETAYERQSAERVGALPGDEDFPEAEKELGASHELG
jgi:hypothetical protein